MIIGIIDRLCKFCDKPITLREVEPLVWKPYQKGSKTERHYCRGEQQK